MPQGGQPELLHAVAGHLDLLLDDAEQPAGGELGHDGVPGVVELREPGPTTHVSCR